MVTRERIKKSSNLNLPIAPPPPPPPQKKKTKQKKTLLRQNLALIAPISFSGGFFFFQLSRYERRFAQALSPFSTPVCTTFGFDLSDTKELFLNTEPIVRCG